MKQLKNIIVGEGFSFEPYYLKNKDGNTVKRQKTVYRPNLNTQSEKKMQSMILTKIILQIVFQLN